jgi:hypothetical protein
VTGDRAPALASFAQRVVRGAVAFMAVTTVAATAVGFWLSYAGLHAFAVRSGLHGAEAWAWPASVDLFILAGELGITISAIRHRKDKLAWCYLLAGSGPSVAFNVLHVATITPAWGRYAVAAVPPIAAMLALGALMRQVFSLAVEAHLTDEDVPVPVRASRPQSPAPPGTLPDRARARAGSKARARPAARAPVTPQAAELAFAPVLAEGTVPSLRAVRRELHVGTDRARVLREHMKALATART